MTSSSGEIGSLGTGPLSYTREEVCALLAPLVDSAPDPGSIGAFIILTAGVDGKLAGWRTDCKAPEQVVGLLAQASAAAAKIISIERHSCEGHTLHPRSPREHQLGDAETIQDPDEAD